MKIMTPRIRALMAGSLLGFTVAASAQDVDLFMQAAGESSSPNLLFIIDNTANWNATIGSGTYNTPQKMIRRSLETVLSDEELIDNIRIGLMPFARGSDGGKIIAHVQSMTETWQTELLSKVTDTSGTKGALNDEGNNAAYALAMNEALRYFSGMEPLVDYSKNHDNDYDPDAVDTGNNRYVSPALNECGRNYQILVGDGEPDKSEDGDAQSYLNALGGVQRGDPISLDPNQREANWADEYARYMAGNDVVPTDIREGNQNVITYVIDIFDPDVNQNRPFKSARALMRSIARWGDGRYFAAHSVEDVQAAMQEILQELLSVNSVFASSSLPVSVNVRGTNLNQVYMGVFRPDAQNRPRWLGNLKLYQMNADADTNTLFLADANGDAAQSSSTGFIVNTATSFWTSPSDFWEFSPRGTPQSISDSADGEVVEKGGAAQRMREMYGTDGDINFGSHEETLTLDDRKVYTCIGCAANSPFTAFNTANTAITDALLNIEGTGIARADVIEWARGHNNIAAENDEESDSSIRVSAHGDVLHSRPAVINVDGHEDSAVYVFYGANDGQFRAVQGGRNSTDGKELWSFIPEEFIGDLNTLRENGADEGEGANKQYFADGSIGVLHDAERTWLFLSMRRGGRLLYALDVTDVNNPKLLWRRGPDSLGGASSDYDELGQTWSMPTPTFISDGESGRRPVLIFGAGYDPAAEDYAGPLSGESGIATGAGTMGRGIFVVDAATGDVIWQAGPNGTGNGLVPEMLYSIPSDPTVLDTNNDGLADRIYVGDTGGNVWRVDIYQSAISDWKVNHLASFTGADGDKDQKFMYPPDVVYTDDGYDAVLIGSGNRENPFDTSVVNHFYMIKDTKSRDGLGDTRYTRADLYDATANLIQQGTAEEQQQASQALAGSNGWFITMENPGEKVVTDATTLNGTTFFSTNQPPPANPDSCVNNLGIARSYEISFADARATVGDGDLTKGDRSSELVGGGFPPSPVPVVVEIDGRYYEAVISGTDVRLAPGAPLDTRFRVWWNKELDS